MNTRRKFNLARLLLLLGGLLSACWGVVSLLGLFDVVSDTSRCMEVIRALGPLGIIMVILGGALCGWDLPSLKKEAEREG